MIPDKASPFRDLITRMFSVVMAALGGGHPEKQHGMSSYDWMAGSSPAMTVE